MKDEAEGDNFGCKLLGYFIQVVVIFKQKYLIA